MAKLKQSTKELLRFSTGMKKAMQQTSINKTRREQLASMLKKTRKISPTAPAKLRLFLRKQSGVKKPALMSDIG